MTQLSFFMQGKKVSPFFVPCPFVSEMQDVRRYTLINVPGGLLAIDLGFKGGLAVFGCLSPLF